MTNASSKVGEAHVDLNLNMKPLEAGLEEAKVVTQETVTEIEDKVVTGNKNIAQSFQQSIGKITAFAGALTAAAGIATVFINVGRKIGEVLGIIADKGSDATFKLSQGFDDNATQAAKLRQEIDSLVQQVQELEDTPEISFISNFFGVDTEIDKNIATLVAKYNRALEELRDAEVRIRREIEAEKAAVEDKAIEESKRRRLLLEDEFYDETVQLARVADREIADIRAKGRETDNRALRESYAEEIKLVEELARLKIQKIQQQRADEEAARQEQIRKEIEAEAEKERRFLEAATRQARALERALTNAIDNASRQTDSLNGRLVTTVEAIESVVRNLNSNTIRRRN